MGERIGLIAGSGGVPGLILETLKTSGRGICLAAVKGEADPEGLKDADCPVRWFGIDQVFDLIDYFKEHGVDKILFAGKIDHRRIFQELTGSEVVPGVILPLEKSAANLVESAIGFFQLHGMTVLDPSPLLEFAFCREGLLTSSAALSLRLKSDIDFGLSAAKNLADLDIGQTVIVKHGTVVAVEGLEGTDEAILRGGRLAGKGTVVVKVSRTRQDPRIDLPAVGLKTVESCIKAESAALCLEADKVLFFQQSEALNLAHEKGLAILIKNIPATRPVP